ncbi:MAG: GerAB/ArcD/ProY family transporter [Wujia sp.]
MGKRGKPFENQEKEVMEMDQNNDKISERQAFRIGILENIAAGMMMAPYITICFAGRFHGLAFLLGLGMVFVYGCIMFLYSKALDKGLERELVDNLGTIGKLIDVFYSMRFMIKAAVLLLFFGAVVNEYLLMNLNQWIVILCFGAVCFYGAAGDIKKRGRLMELIFWWMLVPLILMAVFAVSNISWSEVSQIMVSPLGTEDGIGGIFRGGYILLIVMSGIELMVFMLRHQTENNLHNLLKILIWVMIALMLAYIFIIGILGQGWVGSKGVAAFNVMEASAFPGKTLSRMDYPVLSFWIIGLFAEVSGFVFYGEKCIAELSCFRDEKRKKLIPVIIALMLIIALFLWNVKWVARWLLGYVYIIDLAVSLVVPLIVIWVKKNKKISGHNFDKAGVKKIVSMVLIFGMTSIFITGCLNQYQGLSLENRDYVMTMEVVAKDEVYCFSFVIADLSEYKGDLGDSMETKEFRCEAEGMMEAIKTYYLDKDRQLDLGHMDKMVVYLEDGQPEDYYELIIEMADIPSISKSVTVVFKDEEETEIILRQLIKEIYDREQSSYAGR